MKVQKPNSEVRQAVPKSKDKPDNVDPFTKVLEEKRKEAMPQFSLPAESQTFRLSPATSQPEPSQSFRAPTDIQRLASELVDHISSYRAAHGSPSFEIQFNSQALEGLRVYVLSQQGGIAVNFVAPATRVAGLLQKNLSELRSSLESKGIGLAQLRVSRRPE